MYVDVGGSHTPYLVSSLVQMQRGWYDVRAAIVKPPTSAPDTWNAHPVTHDQRLSVWDRLHEYASTQTRSFTSQEVLSWFRRHAPNQATDSTIRAHVRGASWNVGDRSQFASREPFLTRLDRGQFRPATPEEIESWRAGRPLHSSTATASSAAPSGADLEWHSEEHTQHLLVEWLRQQGWTIVRTANTAMRERGVDVVAERAGERLGAEVKGYPSRFYVNGPKKGQVKVTAPENQAPKWFAHALVPAMKLRGREPEARSVMCFPDFPTYRKLWRETASSIQAAGIEVWLVKADGRVDILN